MYEKVNKAAELFKIGDRVKTGSGYGEVIYVRHNKLLVRLEGEENYTLFDYYYVENVEEKS